VICCCSVADEVASVEHEHDSIVTDPQVSSVGADKLDSKFVITFF